MKMLHLVAVIAFLVNAMADGWVENPTRQVVNFPTDGSVPKRNQGRLAGSEALPTKLHFGAEAWDYFVQSGQGHGLMNHNVGIGFQRASDNKWTSFVYVTANYGYENYEAALRDFALGMDKALVEARASGNVPNSYGVYAMLDVSYYADDPNTRNQLPIATTLWMVNKASDSLERCSIEGLLTPLGPGSTTKIEQLIVPIPNLNRVESWVKVGDEVRTMLWTDRTGMTLANWPSKPVQSAVVGFLYVNGWVASGMYPARISIGTSTGLDTTYVSSGNQLELWEPRLTMVDPLTIEVRAPVGSRVTISKSHDGINWEEFQIIPYSASVTRANLVNPPTGMTLFKATAR